MAPLLHRAAIIKACLRLCVVVRLGRTDGALRPAGRSLGAGRDRVDRIRLRTSRVPGHLHPGVRLRAVDPGGRGAILNGRDWQDGSERGTPSLDAVSDPPMYCCRCGRVARRSVLNDDLNKPATCNDYRIILIFRRVQVETIGKHSLEVAPTTLATFSTDHVFSTFTFQSFSIA